MKALEHVRDPSEGTRALGRSLQMNFSKSWPLSFSRVTRLVNSRIALSVDSAASFLKWSRRAAFFDVCLCHVLVREIVEP